MTFCEMHKPSGCGECPNQHVCQKPENTCRPALGPVATHKVMKCSWGGTRLEVGVSGSYDDCRSFCQAMGWHLDEGYVWNLEIEKVEG